MTKKIAPTDEDVGAAMIAWYQDAIKQFPEGLVTQAQASTMLGVSRVAISRLVARGHLKAVYFPKPPDIEGFVVGQDDPFWIKLMDWFDPDMATSKMPRMVYVSFSDVLDLWKSGDVADKCKIKWRPIFAPFDTKEKRLTILETAIKEQQEQ